MLDFTSSLYLGLRHSSSVSRPWARLTPGVPAALASPPIADAVAGDLAALTGTERALLFRSTLHAFWDLFGSLSRETSAIHIDLGAYPIGRWGVERAIARGVPVTTFPHRDAKALERQVAHPKAGTQRRPLVLADGLCPGCGALVPISKYLDILRPFGGRLVLDDTQSLGIYGDAADAAAPLGRGGGGSLRRAGISDPAVLLVSSLAKGFGAPLAMLGGSRAAVARLEAESETRVHCSPPSFPDLHAAERALHVNAVEGDSRRARLVALIRRFHRGLVRLGLSASRSLFPIQSLDPIPGLTAAALHDALQRRGIRAVLHRPECRPVPTVSFVFTASHDPRAIDRVLEVLAVVISQAKAPVSHARRAV